MHHIAILHDILFPLEAEFSRLTRARFTVEGDVIHIFDYFGADKALLEIGMDDARGAWRAGAFLHGPGAGFLGAGSEKGDEAEQVIAGANQPVQSGLGEFETGKKFVTFRGG